MTDSVPSIQLSIDDSGVLHVVTTPGFELLGKYLASDFRGLTAGPYPDVRAAVENALRTGRSDAVISDGFVAEISKERVTVALLSNGERLVLVPTPDMLDILNTYAEFMSKEVR